MSKDCFVLGIDLKSLMHSANDIFWQETHLQKALTAQQFYGTAEARAIPIPEVQSVDERYCKLYTPDFKLPKQYIHIQGGHKIRVETSDRECEQSR